MPLTVVNIASSNIPKLVRDDSVIPTPPTPPANTYYVDSVAGSDSNSGTQEEPFKTIGKITWIDGITIYLKRNSYFRESIIETVINATLSSYGTGKLPILDCTDIVPNSGWTQPDSSGAPNVWAITITTPDVLLGNFASIWESNARLLFVPDRATCETTTGSFTVTGSSVGNYGTNSVTIEINSATGTKDPNTNGLIYEVPTRPYGISTGTGWTVSNIRAKRNGDNNGSIILNRGCTATGTIAEDGVKHNMLIGAGSILNNCYVWKADYPVVGRDGWIGFVAFDFGLPVDSQVTFNDCFAIVDLVTIQWMIANNPSGGGMLGFGAHTDAATQWTQVNFQACTAQFCAVGFGVNDTVLLNIDKIHTAGCIIGVQMASNTNITDPWIQSSNSINMQRQLELDGDATVTYNVTGARMYDTGVANDGMLFSGGDCHINLTRSSLASLDHTGFHFTVRKNGKNLTQTGVVVDADYSGFGDAWEVTDTPTNLNFNAYSGMDMEYLGTHYAGYPAYFPVVQPTFEANSVGVTADPHNVFIDAPNGNFTLTVASGLDPNVFGVTNPDFTYAAIPTSTDMENM